MLDCFYKFYVITFKSYGSTEYWRELAGTNNLSSLGSLTPGTNLQISELDKVLNIYQIAKGAYLSANTDVVAQVVRDQFGLKADSNRKMGSTSTLDLSTIISTVSDTLNSVDWLN